MKCSNCNQEIGNSTGICPNCGASLNAASHPEQPAPQRAEEPKKSHKGLFIGLGVAAVVAIIAAWFFMRGGSDSSLEKMIPSTASAVVRIDAAQLAEKVGLEINGTDIKLPKRVADLTGSDAKDMQELFGKIKDSGINPLGGIYGFMTNEALTGALLVPLFDQDKAKAFLEKEMEKTFSTIDGGYYLADNNAILMIKNGALLLGASKDNDSEAVKTMASELMDGKRESISAKSDITSSLHNSKAVSLYCDNKKCMSLIQDVPELRGAVQDNPFSFLMNSISASNMTIDIDNNVATLATDITTKDNEYEDFMNTIYHPADNDFLQYMPAGCNAMMAAGVNGKKIASMSQISFLLANLPSEFKTAIESINGTIAAGAAVNPNNPTASTYTILIGSDDANKLLSVIRENLPFPFNMGVVGNYVYISTASEVKAGSFAPSSECKELFKDKWMTIYGSLGIANFEFNANVAFNNAKNAKASFYVNENGKPMKPIEWAVAFDQAQKQFGSGM